jgi:pantothenate kinase type III
MKVNTQYYFVKSLYKKKRAQFCQKIRKLLTGNSRKLISQTDQFSFHNSVLIPSSTPVD